MWHGTIANIPAGYVICDGNNGTPNLLARFVQGVATAATNPGTTGGAATHTLTEGEIPSHTHTVLMDNQTRDQHHPQAQPAGSYNSSGDLNMQTGSKGGGGAHENKPPYYDVAFIMKT